MNKTELAAIVAEKTDIQKKDSEKLVSAVFEAMTEALKNGEQIRLIGFGSFQVKERAAHIGRNPSSGEEIEIPASRTVQFKTGKLLKDAIEG